MIWQPHLPVRVTQSLPSVIQVIIIRISGAAAYSTIYGRPLQISAAITSALNNPDPSKHIDTNKIIFIGFSSGGTTGLLLSGGRIDSSQYISYCENNQTDAICETKGHITVDGPILKPEPDPRIKAIVLMAPVSALFSLESLKQIKNPTLIFTGNKDEELSWHDNSEELAKVLPTSPQLKVITDAGHYVFLAPCSPEQLAITPELCNNPQNVDRKTVHNDIVREIHNFLKKL